MKFTSILGLLAIVAAMDGAAAKNDKKKKGELSEASFVLIGDSTTNNNTVTPNCKYRWPMIGGGVSQNTS
jgi:hypothetical protein